MEPYGKVGPSKEKNVRICILGATGLVGRETLDLVERAWPKAEVHLYASRDQTLEHRGKSLKVQGASTLEGTEAPRGDLALVALDWRLNLGLVELARWVRGAGHDNRAP